MDMEETFNERNQSKEMMFWSGSCFFPSACGKKKSVYDEDNAAMSTHEYKISIPTIKKMFRCYMMLRVESHFVS
jgi:hypothetical protein